MNKLASQIDSLNKHLIGSLHTSYPFGLAHGKMGLLIYLYHLYDYTQEAIYKEKAERLLDDLLENDLSKNAELTVEEGLCGVALGLDYIVKKQFVDGDINDLLSGIDDLLFKKLVFGNMESRYSLSQLIHFLYYIYKRLEIQTNDNERFPFEGLAIKLVNQLADLIDASFFEESYTFSIYQYHVPILMKTLSCLIQYDFYKDRIQKVLEQLSLYMFSHLPHLHLNRLYLLWGILPLRNCSPDWQRYVNELRKSINLDIIYNRETKGKDIYISNGYASLYFLLEGLKRDFPEYTIPFNPHLIYDRIISSDAWDALMENEYYYNIHRGLLNGFPGTVLALLNIKQRYLCE